MRKYLKLEGGRVTLIVMLLLLLLLLLLLGLSLGLTQILGLLFSLSMTFPLMLCQAN